MTVSQKTPVLLIGGAAGTGKTTLARLLSQKLDLVHRIGTGFIREVARCFLTEKEHPELFQFSFKAADDRTPFQQLLKQTEILKGPIESCIERAYREGTSLVIEGTHIVPGFIDLRFVDLMVVLCQPDENMHKQMFFGESHSRRTVTFSDFQACRSVQDELMAVARSHGVPSIDVTDLGAAAEKVVAEIADQDR